MTLDELAGDPEFRDLVAVAVRLLEERCARGVASPAETLAVVAFAEQPDEGDAAAVQAWQPTAEFRAGGPEGRHVDARVLRRRGRGAGGRSGGGRRQRDDALTVRAGSGDMATSGHVVRGSSIRNAAAGSSRWGVAA